MEPLHLGRSAWDAGSMEQGTNRETRGPLAGLYVVGTTCLPVRTQVRSHREQPPSQAAEQDTRSTAKVGKGMHSLCQRYSPILLLAQSRAHSSLETCSKSN